MYGSGLKAPFQNNPIRDIAVQSYAISKYVLTI